VDAISRRTAFGVITGAAAASLPSHAKDNPDSPVAHGVLANNAIAKAFEPTWPKLPDISYWGLEGEFTNKDLRGRTILMPVWAEWCAPCLSELPDFARLQAKYGNAKFEIIPVLSAAGRKLAPPKIAEIFGLLHASALKPVVEKNFGFTLARTMGRTPRGYALPCNVLIAPDGSVIGREMGQVPTDDAKQGDAPPANGDAESVRRAMAGQTQSLWGKKEGEEFAKAMADGFLG
jgi:Thiol-disulfide isomerase and thioredoxins